MSLSYLKRNQANVMLSYPLAEAIELLEQKLGAAQKSLANCEEDSDFLREQITVSSNLSYLFIYLRFHRSFYFSVIRLCASLSRTM